MRRGFAGGYAVCAATLWAAVALAATESATNSTTAGEAAEIGHHARWNTKCESLAAPRVTIEQPPGHGRVCLSEGPVQPEMSRSGVALNCVGKTVQGLHVVYSPHREFTGVDTLRYGLDAPEGHVSRDVSIVIRPAPGSFEPGLAAGAEVQAPGPMPECPPRPVS